MTTPEPTIVTLTPVRAAVVEGTGVPMTAIRDFFDSSFQLLGAAVAQQGVAPATAAFARYAGQPTDTVDLAVGFGVGPDFVATEEVSVMEIPGGRAGQLVHVGGYDTLGASWDRLVGWLQGQGEPLADWFLEEYLTEPVPGADPADMRTRLSYPLATG